MCRSRSAGVCSALALPRRLQPAAHAISRRLLRQGPEHIHRGRRGRLTLAFATLMPMRGTAWAHTPPKSVVRDRPNDSAGIRFAIHKPSRRRAVTFHYGFSAAMGGGEYERKQTFDAALAPIERRRLSPPDPIQPALDARCRRRRGRVE